MVQQWSIVIQQLSAHRRTKSFKNIPQTAPNEKEEFEEEFKERAVEMVLKGDITMTQVSIDLGVSMSCLVRWKKAYLSRLNSNTSSTQSDKKSSEIMAENEHLRKRLRQVEQQRDILKKALGIVNDSTSQLIH